jgi:hypothetical protein
MRKIGQELSYKDICAQIEEEAGGRGTEVLILDFGDGRVVTVAWFGTAAKMSKLHGQLEASPRAAWRWRDVSGDKLEAALKAWARARVKPRTKSKSRTK